MKQEYCDDRKCLGYPSILVRVRCTEMKHSDYEARVCQNHARKLDEIELCCRLFWQRISTKKILINTKGIK